MSQLRERVENEKIHVWMLFEGEQDHAKKLRLIIEHASFWRKR